MLCFVGEEVGVKVTRRRRNRNLSSLLEALGFILHSHYVGFYTFRCRLLEHKNVIL